MTSDNAICSARFAFLSFNMVYGSAMLTGCFGNVGSAGPCMFRLKHWKCILMRNSAMVAFWYRSGFNGIVCGNIKVWLGKCL